MKHAKQLMTFVVCLSFITACRKNIDDKSTILQSASDEVVADNLVNDTAGYVFILGNQTTGNKVLTYIRAGDGKLTFKAAYSTGGKGTSEGLGNQGAVVVTDDKRLLLAVNAGSNEISLLRITNFGLKLLSKVSSGGTKPVSITQYKNLVYVLNSGDEGNISGFRITATGALKPILNSIKPLSTTDSRAAQISFTSDGHALVITEKATNTITTYTVKENGKPGIMHTLPSSNAIPFGFAAGRNNIIYVSETGGGVPGASSLSSYRIMPNGSIKLVDGPVSAHQTDACWVALSKDGKYAYVTNTGSDNISTYRVAAFGKVNIASGIAATSELKPLDVFVTSDGKYLYTRNGSLDIHSYTIGENGTLTNLETISGLPSGATGLATN